jgi:hypothetical protein
MLEPTPLSGEIREVIINQRAHGEPQNVASNEHSLK